MKKTLIAFVATCALFAATSVPVQASLFQSKLTFDGVKDEVDDNSRANLFDNNSNNVLDTGDDIVGLIRLDAFNGTNVNSDELIFGMFAIRITGSVGNVFTHGAATGTNALSNLLSADLKPSGFSFSGDEFLAIVSKKSSASADNPFDSDTDPVNTEIPLISASNGWDLEVIGNFDTTDDFLETKFSIAPGDADFKRIDTNNDSVLQVSEIRAETSTTEVLDERAAFSVDYHDFGAGVQFLGLNAFKLSDGSSSSGDILLTSGAIQTTDKSNSDVADDSNFEINVVPEPLSLGVWALLFVSGIACGFCRRRK